MYNLSKEEKRKCLKSPKLTKKLGYRSRNGVNTAIFSTQKRGISWFTSVQELEDGRASWHRSCYKDAVHAGMLRRARERYERQLEGPNESRRKS